MAPVLSEFEFTHCAALHCQVAFQVGVVTSVQVLFNMTAFATAQL